MNEYTSKIDDEFASLFLQELQNTRSGSTRNESENITGEILGNNDNDNFINSNQSENDYIDPINMETQSSNFMMSLGPASYSRYLPLEATVTNNLLDSNDIYISSSPSKKNEAKYNDQFYKAYGFGIRNEKTPNDYLPLWPLDNKNIDNNSNNNKTLSNNSEILPTSKNCSNLVEEKNKLNTLQAVLQKLLSLKDTKNFIDSNSSLSKMKIQCNISGRLFMDPNTFDKLSQYVNMSTVPIELDLIQLFCYRRNSVNVNFSLDFESLLNFNEIPFDKLSLNLFSVLRKKENKNDIKFNVKEDFKFYGTQDNNITNLNKMNKSSVSFLYNDLIKNCETGNTKIQFNWEQIRFNSATASNRHDIDNKYHIIVLELKFYDLQGFNIYSKTIESNPIIVRGRNPRFYSQKGDILIGKIEKLMNELKHSNKQENVILQSKRIKLESNKITNQQIDNNALEEEKKNVTDKFLKDNQINKGELSENEETNQFATNILSNDNTEEINQFFGDNNQINNPQDYNNNNNNNNHENAYENTTEINQVDNIAKEEHLVNQIEQHEDSFSDDIKYKQYNDYNEPEEEEEDIGNSVMNSSYQYFKVDDNYYLPPVQVGYFPHHVHHNKQVFKTNVVGSRITTNMENKRQYNYFL